MEVLVSDREVLEIREGKRIGNGKEGTCYFLEDDNKIAKIFHEWYKSKKLLFENYDNSQIAFPVDILYNEKNELIGYTMQYLSGIKMLSGFKEELNLQDLKNAYLKLRVIILKFKNLYMLDNCLDNMLYDYKHNKINLIDTSRWIQKEDGEMESINDFNWLMINILLRNINWKQFKLNKEKELFELYLTYQYLENIPSLFLEFINKLEEKVSEYKGYKVKKVKDLKI